MEGPKPVNVCGQVGTTLLNIDGIVYRVDHVTARRRMSKYIDVE